MSEMNHQRLMRLGLLQQHRDTLKALSDRTTGILGSLSDATFLVDPTDPWVIDATKVRNYANELYTVIQEGNHLKNLIAKLEAELGV
jgi:hypothetical protein